MKHWLYFFALLFSLLVILKYSVWFVMELMAAEPTVIRLSGKEQLLIGVAAAYTLTYIIY